MARRNINPNPKRTFSQKKRILLALQAGKTLTPMDAIREFGCTKLASRVSDLILKEGHNEIQKRMVWVTTADGDQAHVMSYYIDPQLDLAV